MSQRVLPLVLLAATLAVASTASASEPVFVRGTMGGAHVRLPNVNPADVTVEAPDPRRFVITAQPADFSTGSRWPRAEFIEHVQVYGPELLGDGMARVVLSTTVSGLTWRLEQDRVDTLVILTGSTPLALEAAEARQERRLERQDRLERLDKLERRRAEEAAEAAVMQAEREAEAARRAGRRFPESETQRLERQLAETQARLRELERRMESGATHPAPAPLRGNETARRRADELRTPVPPPEGTPYFPPAARAGSALPRIERSADGMVRVPAGPFTMGTPMGYGFEDEVPAHAVSLSAFELDELEVSVGAFQASPLPLPRQPDWNWGSDQPVVNVTWGEAAQYCEWAGKRLPTEAEWEKAARGGDGRSYPWGNQWSPTRANSGLDGDGHAKAAPTGSFPLGASPYGALDMSGNVWEWTKDWYDERHYESSASTDPQGPTRGTYRVVRGGSFEGASAMNLRAAIRMPLKASARRENVGFRCAR